MIFDIMQIQSLIIFNFNGRQIDTQDNLLLFGLRRRLRVYNHKSGYNPAITIKVIGSFFLPVFSCRQWGSNENECHICEQNVCRLVYHISNNNVCFIMHFKAEII